MIVVVVRIGIVREAMVGVGGRIGGGGGRGILFDLGGVLLCLTLALLTPSDVVGVARIVVVRVVLGGGGHDALVAVGHPPTSRFRFLGFRLLLLGLLRLSLGLWFGLWLGLLLDFFGLLLRPSARPGRPGGPARRGNEIDAIVGLALIPSVVIAVIIALVSTVVVRAAILASLAPATAASRKIDATIGIVVVGLIAEALVAIGIEEFGVALFGSGGAGSTGPSGPSGRSRRIPRIIVVGGGTPTIGGGGGIGIVVVVGTLLAGLNVGTAAAGTGYHRALGFQKFGSRDPPRPWRKRKQRQQRPLQSLLGSADKLFQDRLAAVAVPLSAESRLLGRIPRPGFAGGLQSYHHGVSVVDGGAGGIDGQIDLGRDAQTAEVALMRPPVQTLDRAGFVPPALFPIFGRFDFGPRRRVLRVPRVGIFVVAVVVGIAPHFQIFRVVRIDRAAALPREIGALVRLGPGLPLRGGGQHGPVEFLPQIGAHVVQPGRCGVHHVRGHVEIAPLVAQRPGHQRPLRFQVHRVQFQRPAAQFSHAGEELIEPPRVFRAVPPQAEAGHEAQVLRLADGGGAAVDHPGAGEKGLESNHGRGGAGAIGGADVLGVAVAVQCDVFGLVAFVEHQ
mmetsp:Transcript_4738/g.13368  ORF Transcript_4738/g.13368 Transcript_4738/m.13368 type:complete len:617 (+) Transcript_4738:3280-5130(+)